MWARCVSIVRRLELVSVAISTFVCPRARSFRTSVSLPVNAVTAECEISSGDRNANAMAIEGCR